MHTLTFQNPTAAQNAHAALRADPRLSGVTLADNVLTYEEPYYTGLSFVLEEKTNVRAVKCLHCRKAIAPRQGRQYTTISVRLHGYLCPACQENSIAFDQLTPALRATFEKLAGVLSRDKVMGRIALDEIKTLCYRADLSAVQVAQWFLLQLEALEEVNYHHVCEVKHLYKQGAFALTTKE